MNNKADIGTIGLGLMGENLNRIDVQYIGLQDNKAVQVAAGLLKRQNTIRYADERLRWISLWGYINEDTTNGSLGIGIVFPTRSFSEFSEDLVWLQLKISVNG